MADGIEKYFLWFPLLVAFLSVFLVMLYMQWRRKHDDATLLNEDKSFTEEIRANLNPDAVSFNGERNISVNREENMDVEQREIEMSIQQEQLKQIFKLMEKDKQKYGITSMEDVQEQMKRYKAC